MISSVETQALTDTSVLPASLKVHINHPPRRIACLHCLSSPPCFCCLLLSSCLYIASQILVYVNKAQTLNNTKKNEYLTPELTGHYSFLPRCLLPTPHPLLCAPGYFLGLPTLNFLLHKMRLKAKPASLGCWSSERQHSQRNGPVP